MIVERARTCGRFIVGCAQWSTQCDVKASVSGSGGPWVNKKRRKKPYTVVLGNVSNANEKQFGQ